MIHTSERAGPARADKKSAWELKGKKVEEREEEHVEARSPGSEKHEPQADEDEEATKNATKEKQQLQMREKMRNETKKMVGKVGEHVRFVFVSLVMWSA